MTNYFFALELDDLFFLQFWGGNTLQLIPRSALVNNLKNIVYGCDLQSEVDDSSSRVDTARCSVFSTHAK